jgi:hypothetical protein
MKRKIILAGAIVVCAFIFTFVLYLGSLKSYIKLLLSLTPVVFGVIQFVASAASAAIIMELLRVSLPSAKSWSEKKHFGLVVLVGLSIFLISIILRVAWNASFIKTLLANINRCCVMGG